jgi:DNA-directed RNA polymerase subunit H (RpoH/RPB5)
MMFLRMVGLNRTVRRDAARMMLSRLSIQPSQLGVVAATDFVVLTELYGANLRLSGEAAG